MAEKDYPKFKVINFLEEKKKRKHRINKARASWRRFASKNKDQPRIHHLKEIGK